MHTKDIRTEVVVYKLTKLNCKYYYKEKKCKNITTRSTITKLTSRLHRESSTYTRVDIIKEQR